ncbi:MAG: hypothetical protein ABJA66_06735 [Actinomycetota bacterium]
MEEHQSGRLKYVETLKYGSVGTHGSKGLNVDNRELFVGGKSFSPEVLNFNDAIGRCEASPNEAVEALKCDSFEHSKETAYVLRMKDDKPRRELTTGNRPFRQRSGRTPKNTP